MANISISMRTYWVGRLEAALAQLGKADQAYEDALNEIDSYTLDTGEARQSVAFKKLDQLEKTIQRLEARVSNINQKINGGGLIRLTLRRYG